MKTANQSTNAPVIFTADDLLELDRHIQEICRSVAQPAAPFERQELATVDHVDNALRIPREGRREFQRELGRAWVQDGHLLTTPNMSRK